MSRRATIFISLTVAIGAAFLTDSLIRDSSFGDLLAYMCYFLSALLASSLKVRLPGITGTISINFLFILIAIAAFSLSETLVLASVACIVQCLWKTTRRPGVLQVSFNVATLAISSGIAYRLAHALADTKGGNLTLLLGAAAFTYFTANTALVSGVLSLVDSRPLLEVWTQCFLWTLPYYLTGAAIAGMVVAVGRIMGWTMPLLLLPLIFMVHIFYRMCVHRLHRPARTV